MTLLAAALHAAECGWPVFPLRPDDKRPAVRDWESRATTDPDRITRCWSAGPYNVGVACGPSGLVVVDLDQPKPDDNGPPAQWQIPGVGCGEDVLAVLAERAGQPLPYDTHLVRTGRAGLHAYYTAPAGDPLRNTAGRLGWLIDTRAAGGYVVAAGSAVGGRGYEVLHEAPTAPLPTWLADLLTPSVPVAPAEPVTLPDTGRRSAYLTAALRAEAARVRNATPGQRNHALYIAAQALGQLAATGALTTEHVRHVLTDASAGHIAAGAYTGRERDSTIASGLRAGTNRPRQIAA
ncbi:MAG TPA: bifunctional DNA primase/polymerase [Mycobacteriales bacterium]|nr:bifunctional DNA primase/polymerase [Mycobacteriales bacterium]